VIGSYVFGQATNPAAIPIIGSATYTGIVQGAYLDAAGNASSTFANMTSTANFATRTLGFSTANSVLTSIDLQGNPVNIAIPNLNMSGNLSYAAGSNQFTGSVNATGLNGVATGKFFGPAAQEIGGVYSLQGIAGVNTGAFAGQ
jgi:hypothetical protein